MDDDKLQNNLQSPFPRKREMSQPLQRQTSPRRLARHDR